MIVHFHENTFALVHSPFSQLKDFLYGCSFIVFIFCGLLYLFVVFVCFADWMVLVWFLIISVNLIVNAVMLKRTEKLEM